MEQESYYNQGLEKAKAGDYQAAVNHFSRALQENPLFAEAHYRRGLALFDLGDQHGAIADYTSAIEIQPNLIAAHFGRSLVRLGIKDIQGSIEDAKQAISIDSSYVSAYRLLGKAYEQLNHIATAIGYHEQAATLYLQQQDEINCRRCLESIKQLKTLLPPSAEDFFTQIVQKVKTSQYPKALADLNFLIQTDPRNAKAYCMRGVVLCRLGNQREAIQDLNLAIDFDPDDPEIRMSRAMIRAEIGDPQGAVDDFSLLLRDTPKWVEAYVGRGLAQSKLGNYRQSIEDFSRAISLNSDDPNLYGDRAMARQKFGDFQGSIADYQQAVNMWLDRGNWTSYQQGLEQIKNLRVALQKQQQQQSQETAKAFQTTQSLEFFPSIEVQNQLLSLVGGNLEIAQRLIDIARQDYPDMTEEWYWKKVIFDLEGDRS